MLSIIDTHSLYRSASLLCSQKDYKKFTDLIEKNPLFSINEDLNGESWNLLHTAAYFDFSAGLEYLINKGSNVNIEEKDGITPLLLAVTNNSFSCIEILLNNNADITKSNKKGFTTLMSAAFNGNKDILELLLNKSNNDFIQQKDIKGQTALDYSKIKNNQTIEILLEKINVEQYLNINHLDIRNKKVVVNKL